MANALAALTNTWQLFWGGLRRVVGLVPWPAAVWAQVLLVVLACACSAALMVWLCRRPAIPKLNLNAYKFAHEPHSAVPGLNSTFASQATLRSPSTGLLLRTHLSMPTHRPGNASARWVTQPKALLIWCPAVHAHMTHYAVLSDVLRPLGFAVAGIDYPGHGLSEGHRGLLPSTDAIVKDVLTFVASLMTDAADGTRAPLPHSTPVFIGGHGYGANVALCCAVAQPNTFSGLLLFAPDLHAEGDRPAVRSAVTAVSAILPKLRVVHIAADRYAKNLAVCERIGGGDPLWVRGAQLAHTTAELSRTRTHVLSEAVPRLRTSFLVQHGLQDLIAHPAGTKQLMDRSTGVPGNLKGWIKHSTGWHDLLHEPDAEELIQHCADYMDERLRLGFLASTLD